MSKMSTERARIALNGAILQMFNHGLSAAGACGNLRPMHAAMSAAGRVLRTLLGVFKRMDGSIEMLPVIERRAPGLKTGVATGGA